MNQLKWLEMQLERAKNDLEDAQKRYDACAELLKVARAEQELKQEVRQEDAGTSINRVIFETRVFGTTPELTIADQVEELLREHGPLRSSQIRDFLKERGRLHSTSNSVNTNLNRHRPARFVRDQEGRWCLPEQRKDDPEISEAVFDQRGGMDEAQSQLSDK